MPEFELPSRTTVKVVYEGVDVSADIAPYILSFEYTDKSSGESDEIQLTLEDREGKWLSSWFPSKGDTVTASIEFRAAGDGSKTTSLPCGKFEVDEIEFSEPPMQITIKGVAAPVTSSVVGTLKTKAWEDMNLKAIAEEISSSNGLTLFWDSSKNPSYKRKDQIQTSDLNFLKGLCQDAALACKCTAGQIVVFDEGAYEEKEPVCTIARGDRRIKSVSFRSKTVETYKAAKVSYHDSLLDDTQNATVTSDDAPDNGKTLEINQKVDSQAEAIALGESKLREANKKEVTGDISLTGFIGIVGGCVVECSGWGNFDGRYFVTSAKHSYSGGGYELSVEIGETAPSKKEKKQKKKTSAQKQKTQVVHKSLLD